VAVEAAAQLICYGMDTDNAVAGQGDMAIHR
jgi:hypothetical protein